MSWIIVEHAGARHRVAVAKTAAGTWVGWPGGAVLVQKEKAFASAAPAEGDICAPMTGKIVRVEVAAGDAVEKDQVLVVLEAMKMEYRLTAPHAGEVESVACEEGELVEAGTNLVVLSE